MIDKRVKTLAEAMHGIKDGSLVLLGGFGVVGQPQELLEGLIAQGARDLTIVSNNAGFGSPMLPRLFAAGRGRELIWRFSCPPPPGVDTPYQSRKSELAIVAPGPIPERAR